MVDEQTLFEALADRQGHTAADLRKAAKADGDDLDAALEDFKARGLVSVDDSGKSEKFTLTDEGWRTHRARYVKDQRTGLPR